MKRTAWLCLQGGVRKYVVELEKLNPDLGQTQMDAGSCKITAVSSLPLHVNAAALEEVFLPGPCYLQHFSYFPPPRRVSMSACRVWLPVFLNCSRCMRDVPWL